MQCPLTHDEKPPSKVTLRSPFLSQHVRGHNSGFSAHVSRPCRGPGLRVLTEYRRCTQAQPSAASASASCRQTASSVPRGLTPSDPSQQLGQRQICWQKSGVQMGHQCAGMPLGTLTALRAERPREPRLRAPGVSCATTSSVALTRTRARGLGSREAADAGCQPALRLVTALCALALWPAYLLNQVTGLLSLILFSLQSQPHPRWPWGTLAAGPACAVTIPRGTLAGNTATGRAQALFWAPSSALTPGPQAAWDLKIWCLWKVTQPFKSKATVLGF